jgi:hypothetical protein
MMSGDNLFVSVINSKDQSNAIKFNIKYNTVRFVGE